MLNKQKFNFFRNWGFALQGLKEVFANESSFKIEVYIVLALLAGIIAAPLPILHKGILSTSMLIPLAAELAN
ncbi:diacylglycerol kinase, partial [Seleniivibrio woodruffii]|uniref:diacylglycerol kinase n=1 Tax=Seleniivibrio woodruffii TaxID=1078050 RepID=UPI002409EC5C